MPRRFPPSPQPVTIYSGPTVPTAYDSNWQYFTNLTLDQIAWFQAQPEWAAFLAYVALSPKTATPATPAVVVSGALSIAGNSPTQTALFVPPSGTL